MKLALRFAAVLALLVAVGSTKSAASTVLCTQGPTAGLAGNNSWKVIYTCTIPANTLSTGHALRVTSEMNATTGVIDVAIFINGVQRLTEGIPVTNGNYYWDFLLMDTGATTGYIAGLMPWYDASDTEVTVHELNLSVTGLNWGAAQTVSFEFDGGTSTFAQGTVFVVEVL